MWSGRGKGRRVGERGVGVRVYEVWGKDGEDGEGGAGWGGRGRMGREGQEGGA